LRDPVDQALGELNRGEVFGQIRLKGIDVDFFDYISITQWHRKRIATGLTESQGNADKEKCDTAQKDGIGGEHDGGTD